jgi:osmotically-inducible protein OsmY
MAVLLAISTAGLLTACGERSTKYSGHRTEPDNSAVNARDVKSDNPNAADQSEAPADRDMTQHIRQAVMADDSLSSAAHNVKIITVGGRVTLRGPVDSDVERTSVQEKAQAIAGATNVDNQLEVKH